jgi:sulfite reductase (NADPH) hemoprotein beta-component
LIRQWSTFHPEFLHLPRKFKIAVNGAESDRAGIRFHDIGVEARLDAAGEVFFRIFVGGGLGRTPILGHVINAHLPWADLLTYLDAVLRVYNRLGRRDNPYKARVKITVKEMGLAAFQAEVEREWAIVRHSVQRLTKAEVARVASHFVDPAYPPLAAEPMPATADVAYARWLARNVRAHKRPGYAAVVLSLKPNGVAPGDATSEQMDAIANLADTYSFGEVRVTHEQNLVLADVAVTDLAAVWQQAKALGLATPNIGLLTDIIACPGGSFCSLANAVSIPVANAIQDRFENLDYLHDLGEIELNISGCMNSCAQHHVAHIGVLGVDKQGKEFYQISLGGQQGDAAALGRVIGPAFAREEVPDVVERLLARYVTLRADGERFIDTLTRLGSAPFVEAAYPAQKVRQSSEKEVSDAVAD